MKLFIRKNDKKIMQAPVIKTELSYSDELSELFKVLGDKTRIQIIRLLDAETFKVGDLAAQLDMTDSAISHQLAILREHHIVKSTRNGREIYYALDDEHISLLYELGLKHIKHKIQETCA